jgi:2'-5' RNA ligase
MPEVVKPERLFVGVPIATGTREKLLRRVPRDLPGRMSPAENWHFTLRFLGATLPDQKERVVHELSVTEFGKSFEIQFDGLGAFPNARKARVIWLGVGKGGDRLSDIATLVEGAAVRSGFEAERRKFSPHLTLSRLKDPVSVAQVLSVQKPISESMRVEKVILYESKMGGPHSRYSVVTAFPLDC